MFKQLLVDPLGGSPQSQLPQGREIGGGKIVLERSLRLLGDVDLAFFETLDQIVGRQVDKLDGIGAIEN